MSDERPRDWQHLGTPTGGAEVYVAHAAGHGGRVLVEWRGQWLPVEERDRQLALERAMAEEAVPRPRGCAPVHYPTPSPEAMDALRGHVAPRAVPGQGDTRHRPGTPSRATQRPIRRPGVWAWAWWAACIAVGAATGRAIARRLTS